MQGEFWLNFIYVYLTGYIIFTTLALRNGRGYMESLSIAFYWPLILIEYFVNKLSR